ncbi:50S ribosomal protein L11 [archaeon]|nr:50S ribosomal protein L11 [archaeon]
MSESIKIEKVREVSVLVEGGKATPGPPLGPALGPLGIPIGKVVAEINKLTQQYQGMKVPVRIRVNIETKEYSIEVGSPPTSALILRELGAEKGSSAAGHDFIGNLSMEQVVKIAKMKAEALGRKNVKAIAKEVLGTCVSIGVLVEGKHPKEVIREVSEGKWDNLFGKG